MHKLVNVHIEKRSNFIQSTTGNFELISNNYVYSYDALNRITEAIDILTTIIYPGLSYDKMGNILSLQRQGQLDADATVFGTMDNLGYTYNNGNQLQQVDDFSNNLEGFNDGNPGIDYTYDTNGNIKTDANKGITGITYNFLNLPESVTLSGGIISYIYDATGVKQKKIVNESGNITETQYAGNFIYQKLGSSGPQLQFFSTEEGYVEPKDAADLSQGFNYVYNYTDHLGNVRLSYSDLDLDGSINPNNEILSEKNYYPFGLVQKGYNNTIIGTENNHKTFQGQEISKELGYNMLEFKYRHYDPAIGRFATVDPLAEDYSYQSPYNFAENRVMDGIELEGLEWKSVKDEETGNTNVTLTIQLQDKSGLNDKQLAKVKENFQEQFSESFSGEGFSGQLIIEDAVDSKGDFLVTLTDQKPNAVYDKAGNIVGEKYSGGKTPKDGSTQKNSFDVTAKTDGAKRGYSSMARSFSHEAGHSAGLLHPWDSGNTVTDIQQGSSTVENKTVRKNLMNSDQNPSSTNKGTSGKNLTNGQLKSIDKLTLSSGSFSI